MSAEIERLEAEIVKRDARITELEKFADEANAQMLEAFAERDQAMKAQQPSAGVVLPERKAVTQSWNSHADAGAIAHNACLDEVARLNPCRAASVAVPDGHRERTVSWSDNGNGHQYTCTHDWRGCWWRDDAGLLHTGLECDRCGMIAAAPSVQQKESGDE